MNIKVMDKKILLPTILFVVILTLAMIILIKDRNVKSNGSQDQDQKKITNDQSGIVFYYGSTCPHCKLVEDFFNQNDTRGKIKFAEKEVYQNKQNQNDLLTKAKICGLATNAIGVPFLWDGQKCLIGDELIINFFKEKTNGK
jgi:glutaredoxin